MTTSCAWPPCGHPGSHLPSRTPLVIPDPACHPGLDPGSMHSAVPRVPWIADRVRNDSSCGCHPGPTCHSGPHLSSRIPLVIPDLIRDPCIRQCHAYHGLRIRSAMTAPVVVIPDPTCHLGSHLPSRIPFVIPDLIRDPCIRQCHAYHGLRIGSAMTAPVVVIPDPTCHLGSHLPFRIPLVIPDLIRDPCVRQCHAYHGLRIRSAMTMPGS